jgi:hypothetical protein
MTQDADRRERSTDPAPPSTDPVDANLSRFNAYLVEFVEELTGYRLQMAHWGTVFACRVQPVSPVEKDEGVQQALSGHDGPKKLVETIHTQARITQRIAMRDATHI